MALVSLGQRDLFIGALPVVFDSFSYNQRRAYKLELQFNTNDFGNVFSTAQLQAVISPNNLPTLLDWRKFDFDIVSDRILMFYPLNRLLDNNGDVAFRAERLPIWRGGNPGIPVSLELFYDDSNDIRSWID